MSGSVQNGVVLIIHKLSGVKVNALGLSTILGHQGSTFFPR